MTTCVGIIGSELYVTDLLDIDVYDLDTLAYLRNLNFRDGAAIAAAVAHYVADLRTQGKERENLTFYTAQLLSAVAHRHSGVEQQPEFETWTRRLELDQPEKFLIRLRNVVDVLVQDDWWIDREAIQAELPVN